MIPKKHTNCSYCILGGRLDWPDPGAAPPEPGLCKDHKGEDGQPVEYTGHDAHEPKSLYTIGYRFRAWDKRTYLCTGYDPRHGFWMRSVDEGKPILKNVSERAVGRTFHRVDITWGAFEMLKLTGSLERFPTEEEAEGIWYTHARENLIHCGFLTSANTITTEGSARLASGEPI